MAFNPLRALRERLYGDKDLGGGRVDAALERVTEGSERLRQTIEEIARDPDPLATLVHNMNQSRMHRSIEEESDG